MVAEALVVTAREGRVDRRHRLALPVFAEDLLENRNVEVVELIVEIANLFGDGDIRVLSSSESFCAICTSTWPMLVKVLFSPLGIARSGKR